MGSAGEDRDAGPVADAARRTGRHPLRDAARARGLTRVIRAVLYDAAPEPSAHAPGSEGRRPRRRVRSAAVRGRSPGGRQADVLPPQVQMASADSFRLLEHVYQLGRSHRAFTERLLESIRRLLGQRQDVVSVILQVGIDRVQLQVQLGHVAQCCQLGQTAPCHAGLQLGRRGRDVRLVPVKQRKIDSHATPRSGRDRPQRRPDSAGPGRDPATRHFS